MSLRVEKIGDCTIYNGDMLEIVPTLAAIDHVITDPPYEDELHNAMGRIRRNDGREMVQSLGFDGVNADRSKIASTVVAACTGWAVLFTLAEGVRAWRDDLQAAGAKWDTCLAWIKPDSSPRFNGQGAARGFECAVTAWCGPGYRKWNGGGKRGVYTFCVNTARDGRHPTEKPVPLMSSLVLDYTMHGQTVLDPFLGIGATLIACAKTGRNGIGIEENPKHFDVACERIEAAYRQPDLFVEPPAPPEQMSLLGALL